MSVYECRGCGALYNSNGKPNKCGACGAPSGNHPEWYRVDSVDELFG